MNKSQKYYLNAVIVVLFMLLFRFLPTFASMTPLGMAIMGIFIGALWGWISCDMIWPSILALTMLGFTGYAENVTNVQAVLTQTISNGSVQLILWLLVFSALLTTTGISEWCVKKLVASKLCKGHPWRLSFIICFATWVCAAFGAGFAAILICWQLVYTICEQTGYTKKDKWPKMMICSIIFFNALGAMVLPFQGGVVGSFGYLANAMGDAYTGYSYIHYLAFSIIFSASVMLLYMLICRFLIRPDMSQLGDSIDVGNVSELNTKQKMAIGALVTMMLVMIVPSCLPMGPVKTFFTKLGTTACVLLIVGFVTFLRDKNGKPYFTFRELANGGILWPMLFMVATAITVGGALATPATGFTATVTSLFAPILKNASPYVCAAVIALATMTLTNLINNSVACAIMIPVMYPFASSCGINPVMLTTVICFCANCGLLLPCASPAGAMMHGNKDWLNTKDVEKHAIIGIISILLVTFVIGIPLGSFLFR